ncbi:MAG: LysR family transcriptional regulator [Deltaproteobacteria bacterium]|nr:LysR family transcriptional regulator [Deltaproteobacteria bacterium]
MDLRRLRFFTAVAETENFTRAAERLHIAQPALSVAIRQLEEEIGLSLFSREGKKTLLTAEGKVFLEHARRILAAVRTAETQMGELRGLDQGEVRIGVPAQLGSYFFPALFVAFKRRHPRLRCSVFEYGTRRIGEMLCEGLLELGVVALDNPPAELEIHPFLEEEMVACLPAGHPLAAKAAVSYGDFAAEPLVLFEKSYFHREVIGQISAHAGAAPNVVFETNLIPLLKAMVRSGFGITTLLRMVVERDEDLVAIPFDPPIRFGLGIAWKRDSHLSLANRAFVDFLLEQKAFFKRSGRI